MVLGQINAKASEVGRAIADNSANMFPLGQEPETITHLAREGRLPLSSFGIELLRTVHTVADHYGEVYCHTDGGAGVGRLAVSPGLQLLYSTHPRDTQAIEHFRSRGMSVLDAISAVLEARDADPGNRAA